MYPRSIAALILAVCVPGSALAEVPLPLQPGCGDSEDLSVCPQEAGDWTLWNFTPASFAGVIDPAEAPLGIGNGVLPAWQITTGRWDQIIAVADSGVMWSETQIARKVFLHVGELPLPQDANGIAAANHDRDGNGLVNITDYSEDPRVDMAGGAPGSHHMLDASDLIAAFSDGVDDDGNGYIDDIAGWDFFENDNDPFATNTSNYGDHGTGVLVDAGAEGNNGGRIGVCPSCAVLPIRVGDSFITTGPHIAQAILFASEHRAAALGMALGGMTDSAFVREAIDLAWERGTVIVAAAGDETSFHRNFPASHPRILNVHSISASNRDDIASASSFLRFVNCNNFGGRIDLVSATKNACATGSVAQIAGAVALVQSAAMEHTGARLSPAELTQLLLTTATDIDLPGSRGQGANDDLFPSYPGWDAFFGWGRIHVGRAVQAVVDAAMPPVAEITGPEWFSHHDQREHTDGPDGPGPLWSQGGIAVTGIVGGAGVSWRLDRATGTDIAEDGWIEVARGDGTVDGELARLEVAQSWREEIPSPEEATGCSGEAAPTPASSWVLEGDALEESGYQPTFTPRALRPSDTITARYDSIDGAHLSLRLTVTDGAGRTSEARRQIFVRRDERLLPGFPKQLGASLEPSPTLADLDGDGVFEVIQAATDGQVHVFGGDGRERAGWPVRTGPFPTLDPANPDHHRGVAAYATIDPDGVRQAIVGSPSVGDLDGDGRPEIVAPTLSGALHVWGPDGVPRSGFPVFVDPTLCDPADRDDDVRTDCGIFGTPALADLDGDGRLDIVVGAMDQHLYAWDADGALLDGFPAFVQAGPDLPDAQGQIARIVSSPAVGDIDGDGDLEIVVGTGQTAGSDFAGYGLLYALDHRGALIDGWPIAIFAGFAGALPYIGEGVVVSPALVDLDGDGDLEIVASAIADPGTVYNHDGTDFARLSAIVSQYGVNSTAVEPSALLMVGNPSLGDVNGDGVVDIFVGGSGISYGLNIVAWTRRFEHQHLLLGYGGTTDGTAMKPLAGFPQVVEDIQFFTSPAIADVTGDGRLEVVHGSTYTTRAYTEAGPAEPPPWLSGGWQMAAPAVGDIDGDGLLDLVVATREGWLFAWRTVGIEEGAIAWPQFRHDARHTGNFGTPLPQQAGPQAPPGAPPAAGGCSVGSAPGVGGLGVVGALALLGRRRRR